MKDLKNRLVELGQEVKTVVVTDSSGHFEWLVGLLREFAGFGEALIAGAINHIREIPTALSNLVKDDREGEVDLRESIAVVVLGESPWTDGRWTTERVTLVEKVRGLVEQMVGRYRG